MARNAKLQQIFETTKYIFKIISGLAIFFCQAADKLRGSVADLWFNCQAVKVSIDEVSLMPLPSILFWKEKHFVVLASVDSDKYEILDPAEGRLYFKKDEFVENFISSKNFGIALVMEDTPKFYEQKKKINRFERNNGLIPLIKKSYIENKK